MFQCSSIIGDSRFAAINPTRKQITHRGSSGLLSSETPADSCLGASLDCLYDHDAHCCRTGTAIKHLVPDRVKPSFVIFDIRAL